MTDATTTLQELKSRVRGFVSERRWEKYHSPKNLAMSLAIEAAELMEHFQWIESKRSFSSAKNKKQREEIADEMADVLAYLLALSNVSGIDLSESIERKMRKNELKYPAAKFRGRYRKPKG